MIDDKHRKLSNMHADLQRSKMLNTEEEETEFPFFDLEALPSPIEFIGRLVSFW
jgi:hypothetical protein